MAREDDPPAAVRATAFVRPSRWLRRPVRMVRYDAWWEDGRVELDVNLAGLMYRRAPADFEPVDRAVHATCPEVGVGSWVDRWGGVVAGPGGNPAPPGTTGGRRRRYRPPTSPAEDAERWRAWGIRARLGGGALGVGLGVPLLAGAAGDGVAGPVGVVCVLGGVVALAGLVPARRRP